MIIVNCKEEFWFQEVKGLGLYGHHGYRTRPPATTVPSNSKEQYVCVLIVPPLGSMKTIMGIQVILSVFQKSLRESSFSFTGLHGLSEMSGCFGQKLY